VNTLRTLKKLVLGETWTLPIGVLASVGLAAAFSGTASALVLLAGVLVTLLAGVGRSARRR
jgi:hypothetical protein